MQMNVRDLAIEAVQEWVDEKCFDPKDFKQEIHRILDKQTETVVAKLLGFDNKWGKWELDHCNGRAGESAVGDYVKNQLGPAVKEWLDEQINGELPKLSEEAILSMKQEYLNTLRHELRDSLRNLARHNARNIANKIVEEIGGIMSEDNMQSALNKIRFVLIGDKEN